MLQKFNHLLFFFSLTLPVVRSYLHGPNANTATDLFNALGRRYNDGPKPARDDVARWAALGDSFSAGPGAGCAATNDEGTCWRRLGAYAPQLNQSGMFQNARPAGFGQPEVDFGACSGAKMPKMRNRQMKYVSEETEFATVSIGGNDIFFGDILQSCVVFPAGACDEQLQKARDELYSLQLYSTYKELFETMHNKMGWVARANRRTALYVTAYPTFFDTWTPQCNEAKFAWPGVGGVKLTQELRNKFNLLNQELNYVLSLWLDEVNYQKTAHKTEAIDFVKFVNHDETFNGHRFCRANVIEPDRNNINTWFFNFFSKKDPCNNEIAAAVPPVSGSTFLTLVEDQGINPTTCNATSDDHDDDAGGDFYYNAMCATAQTIQNGTWNDTNAFPNPLKREDLFKSFHPRTPGYQAESKFLQEKLAYGPTLEPKDKQIKVMPIGDSLTIGIGGALGGSASYRQELFKILNNPSLNNQVEFVGTPRQGLNGAGWDRCEFYLGAANGRVAGLTERLQNNKAVQKLQPNVVLLMAGTIDIDQGVADDLAGIQTLVDQLEALIDEIWSQKSNAMILLAQIPVFGRGSELVWPPTIQQKHAIQYNALMAELVNRRITKDGRPIRLVHPSSVTNQNQHPGGIYPNDPGYIRIAYDFAERIADVFRLGLVDYLVGNLTLSFDPTTTGSSASALKTTTAETTTEGDTPTTTKATITSSTVNSSLLSAESVGARCATLTAGAPGCSAAAR